MWPHPSVFQSTRPQGARPLSELSIARRKHVSIHAPAGGATPEYNMRRPDYWCFNPRARRGRDSRNNGKRCGCLCFNPRARRGRDRDLMIPFRYTAAVSIHAPAGGATSAPMREISLLRCFNPRARRGRDERPAVASTARKMFQSTRPQGARLVVSGITSDSIILFQSTRPQGARPADSLNRRTYDRFQSTRPQGARRPNLSREAGKGRFNPRARRGRDVPWAVQQHELAVSIHAPAGGATGIINT